MNDLDHFREYTDRTLAGLSADETLRNRILAKASGAGEKPVRRFPLRPVLALGSMICVLVLGVVLLNGIHPLPSSMEPGGITVFAAGQSIPDGDVAKKRMMPLTEMEADSVDSVEWTGVGVVRDASACRSLAKTLVSESVPAEVPGTEAAGRLVFTMKNGSVVQFSVEEPYLFSEDCWSCQPFFEQFRNALP